MSKENENRDEVDDKEENLEDPEGSEEQEGQEDEEKAEQDGDIDWEARAKKAEALIVKNKKEEKKDDEPDSKPDGDYLTREEAVLLKDMDVEDLDKLKAVQKGEGHSSLKEARESDLFKSYMERKKEEKKKKDAKLGASKGSGGGDSKFKPGMSDEEHEKAAKERIKANS